MKARDDATEVTAAGIARLAGVGRAAVSNWRRRHGDFPKPVGGTETSPSFALADVERWLRAQGKLIEVPLRERVWQQLAGHPAGPVTALLHAGCALLLVRDRPPAWLALSAVSDERMAQLLPGELEDVVTPRFGGRRERAVHVPEPAELLPSVPLLRGVAELAAELGARGCVRVLLGRQTDANPRQYTLTPAAPPPSWPGSPPARPPPAPSSTPPAAPRRCCAPSSRAPTSTCTARTAHPNWPPSPRCASPCTPTRPSARGPPTPCAPTPTTTAGPMPCSATRRSTNATGATTNWPTTPAGSTASRPASNPNSPGSSTRWPASSSAAPPSC